MNISSIKNISSNKITQSKAFVSDNPLVKNNQTITNLTTANALYAMAMLQPKEISEKELINDLKNFGYEENPQRKCFTRKNFSDEELAPYQPKYGQSSNIVLGNITELSYDNINDLKDFINLNPQKGKKMYKENFTNLVNTFCTLKFNNNLHILKDKSKYVMLTNIITNPLSPEVRQSFLDYKGKVYEEGIAKDAQKYLRNKASNPDLKTDEKTAKFIDNISSYIETQPLQEKTVLYRGERLDVLNNIEFSKDKTLAQAMKEVTENYNPKSVEEIKSFIKNNNISAKQPAFMSTTLNRDNPFERNNWIFWTLETAPNTKGIYLDGMNTSFYSFQDEVLLQKGSQIKIKDLSYDYQNKIWYLNGEVSN